MLALRATLTEHNMKRTDLTSRLRPILLAQRDSLRRSLDGELSLLNRDDDEDESHEEQLFSALSRAESHELAAIDAALQRIRNGSFGECEVCGRSIALARLQALPYASTCIRCQQDNESHSPSRARQPAFA